MHPVPPCETPGIRDAILVGGGQALWTIDTFPTYIAIRDGQGALKFRGSMDELVVYFAQILHDYERTGQTAPQWASQPLTLPAETP